jgi:hypothetical protein
MSFKSRIVLTTSEEMFEAFCKMNGVKWRRVPISTGRTPDYEIAINGQRIVVEVKQIDPNPQERLEIEAIAAKRDVFGGSGAPGDRMRSVIADANGQLKSRSQGKYPSLLVVYDNVPHACHTAPYSILVAMYGLQQLNLSVPETPNLPIRLAGESFGGKRKMTPVSNTSTSAVAVLKEHAVAGFALDVYHNIFAAVTLDPTVLAGLPIRQYTLPCPGKREFQNWIEVTSS